MPSGRTLDPQNSRARDAATSGPAWLRQEMPVAGLYAYFDHAAVAPLPRAAARALGQYAEEASEHGDAKWPDWAAKVEALRLGAAELLGAQPAEIALLGNTTQGIQVVASGLNWQPGDNVVVPANEFPSNLLPWRELQSKGVEIREVNLPETEELTVDSLRTAIDAHTRLLALSWVGYASGYRVDVAQMVEYAHAHGCLVMLDAIQGMGAFPLNVAECGVDFLAADGHKWLLGPEGAGVFYCRQDRLEQLAPVGVGWNSLSQGAFDGLPPVLKESAGRFEGGTMNVPGCHGLNASIQVLLEAGINQPGRPLSTAILENVATLEVELARAGFELLLPSDEAHRSGIVGVTWPAARAQPDLLMQARRHLMRQRIVTSVRAQRLRLSTHAYNDSSDIGRLVQALTEFQKHA